MSRFSPQDLVYFQEVSRTKNLSRAAERLGIAQPSLTLAMRRLESHTETPLLIRKKTGVELTHAGKVFLQRSELVLREWTGLLNETKGAMAELSGRFSIGCHPSVGQYSLPSFLPEFLASHRQIEIRLHHGLSRHITELVIRYELDFGIVVNPVAHPDLRIVELGRDVVTYWCSPRCQNRDVLIYDPELLQAQRLLEKLGKYRSEFRREVHSASLELISKLAVQGAGVGILPGRVAAVETSSSRQALVTWNLPSGARAPRYEDRICMIYRPDRQKTRASKAVMEALVRSLERSTTQVTK
ncbi:MAG: hypothetical protein RJB38_832 [Pseudomonadota bacterium]|jgi:DNA-binding transcriptional LysR family regulator